MDRRNRIGLYGSYFLGVSGIGFTLPYLPLYLSQQGLSNRVIGVISTLAAVAGLAQFPLGVWSDRLDRRKPFLVVALAVLAAATVLLHGAQGVAWLAFLVVLFAENGICRAIVESLAGAEATHLATPDRVGAALGALRFWKPIGIVLVALGGSVLAEHYDVGSILLPLAGLQTLAVVAALLIHGDSGAAPLRRPRSFAESRFRQRAGDGTDGHLQEGDGRTGVRAAALMTLDGQSGADGDGSDPEFTVPGRGWQDVGLGAFILAVVLFHAANAPGGVYLGLFLKQDLGAPDRLLAYAFVVSMAAWMLVVRPAGRLADRLGRKPLLVVCWAVMAVRLALVALAGSAWQVVGIQVLDGVANGLFAVLAAAWVTDRFADPRRLGQAQVLVGSALVFGSAAGPMLSGFVVDALGYRGMFGLLAGVGVVATTIVFGLVPETVKTHREEASYVPLDQQTDLSTTP